VRNIYHLEYRYDKSLKLLHETLPIILYGVEAYSRTDYISGYKASMQY